MRGNKVFPPIVVGGTGGSGTRLVARLLREMGVEMGGAVNESEDALEFVPLLDRYIDAFISSGVVEMPRFRADLSAAMGRHALGMDPMQRWGWKNPRTIYLLPLLDRSIPGLTFIHVIRHGFDMALSMNQNQLEKHGRAVLGRGCDRMTRPMASALLWQRINEGAADYGKCMPGRYFLLRYEDVCRQPRRSMMPIAKALRLKIPAEGFREPILPHEPRWPGMEPELRAKLKTRIGRALKRFSYPC